MNEILNVLLSLGFWSLAVFAFFFGIVYFCFRKANVDF